MHQDEKFEPYVLAYSKPLKLLSVTTYIREHCALFSSQLSWQSLRSAGRGDYAGDMLPHFNSNWQGQWHQKNESECLVNKISLTGIERAAYA